MPVLLRFLLTSALFVTAIIIATFNISRTGALLFNGPSNGRDSNDDRQKQGKSARYDGSSSSRGGSGGLIRRLAASSALSSLIQSKIDDDDGDTPQVLNYSADESSNQRHQLWWRYKERFRKRYDDQTEDERR